MAERSSHNPSEAAQAGESDLLSLRVSADVAESFRLEAVRRHLRQNALFEEMWRIYCEAHDVRA